MKFSCNTQALGEAVMNVSRAVSGKSALPALEGILIATDGDKIILSGYDLEIAIKTTVRATVAEEGCAVLSAKLFGEMIRKADSESITLNVDEKQAAVITAGNSKFSIMAIDANDYPELPAISDNRSIEIDCEMLKSMVEQTIFAVSTSETRPVHTGILFEIEDENLRLIAVDGYRLAIRNEKINNTGSMRFIIPAKTLNEILKLIGENDKTVQFHVAARHISFDVGNFLVISRLLEGDFLDYKSAIPDGAAVTVIADTKALIDAVDRISLLITDLLKSPVRCTFEENKAFLRCTTAIGRASDVVDCSISGGGVEVGFNNKYFLDAMRAVDSDQVKIELGTPKTPIKILPMEGDSFLFLVVPVILKAE